MKANVPKKRAADKRKVTAKAMTPAVKTKTKSVKAKPAKQKTIALKPKPAPAAAMSRALSRRIARAPSPTMVKGAQK